MQNNNQQGVEDNMFGAVPAGEVAPNSPVGLEPNPMAAAPSGPAAPAGLAGPAEKKKNSAIVPVMITIIVALIVVAAVGFAAYSFGKQDGEKASKKNSVSSSVDGNKSDGDSGDKKDKKDDEEKTEKEEVVDKNSEEYKKAAEEMAKTQRNETREDDLALFVTGAVNYQANNSGKIPFGNGQEAIGLFISRYIDRSCSGTFANGTFSGGCKDVFVAPSGVTYHVYDMGTVDIPSSGESDVSKSIVKDESFYAYVNAMCGNDGTIKKGSGSRSFAVFIKLEGGRIACNDNH